MKRAMAAALLAAIIVTPACHRRARQEARGLVSHKPSTIAFTGYKSSVKVKAKPMEVDQYLRDLTYFNVRTEDARLKVAPGQSLRNLGDGADIKVEVLGIPFPSRFVMVQHQPGEQIWLIAEVDRSVMSILRMEMKPMEDGTRVTLKMELEDTSSLVGQFSQAVNAPEILARLIEQGMAVGQAHFDPSITPEQLLAQGIRGEYFSAFYQAHEASIWVNASTAKVDQYLKDGKTWERYNAQYKIGIGQCALLKDSTPCPIQLKLLGFDYDLNSFIFPSKPEETTAYWVSSQLVSRMKIFLKPERSGSRLTFSYAMETPLAMSQEGRNLLINIAQMPSLMEKMLLDAKRDREGAI